MTETYEKFIQQNIENLDCCLIELYGDYEENSVEYFDHIGEDRFVLFENSEEWFKNIFCEYILQEGKPFSLQNYELLRIGKDSFEFKHELMEAYGVEFEYEEDNSDDDEEDSDDVNHYAKMDINTQFVSNYINNILTFDHLKNVLYDIHEYNEVFADEVELK